ncbi:MAG: hypothetical protein PSW75_11540 [bacterium]|nr:hypothetical protein [bacterium]MDI1336167.1 hypothetical protein [Lacunisphaera sp.]
MKHRLSLVLATLVVLTAGPLRAADSVGAVLAKARAFLGSESALGAVGAIHFTGTLEVDANTRLPVDIVFQKPFQQRITVTSPKLIEVTALDGYDAWKKRTNPTNSTEWQVTLLDAGQVKRLRANTWENLNFFTGIEKKGGKVQAGGEVTVDGVACTKLTFVHADNIVFSRYFDKATGRLVKTETENGTEIREEGEISAGGVRFPKRVINKAPNGAVTTITFDKVELNAPLAGAEFAVPTLRAN